MKVGNVSQTVLKRSVLKTTAYKKEKEILTPFGGRDVYCGYRSGDTERCGLLLRAVVFWENSKKYRGVYAIMRAVLDLETRGGFGQLVFRYRLFCQHMLMSRG